MKFLLGRANYGISRLLSAVFLVEDNVLQHGTETGVEHERVGVHIMPPIWPAAKGGFEARNYEGQKAQRNRVTRHPSGDKFWRF